MKDLDIYNDSDMKKFIDDNNESYEVEYKEDLKNLEKSVLRTMCAFANSNVDKGRLIIGVKDNKSILGTQEDINSLTDKIKDKFQGNVPFFKIREFKVFDKQIIVIDTYSQGNKPYLVEGRAFKRVGHSSNKVEDYREMKLLENSIDDDIREWMNGLNATTITTKLVFGFYPRYLVGSEEKEEIESIVMGIREKYKNVTVTNVVNLYINSQNYSIEIDLNTLIIKVIILAEEFDLMFIEITEKICEIINIVYNPYKEKEICMQSKLIIPMNQDKVLVGDKQYFGGFDYHIQINDILSRDNDINLVFSNIFSNEVSSNIVEKMKFQK